MIGEQEVVQSYMRTVGDFFDIKTVTKGKLYPVTIFSGVRGPIMQLMFTDIKEGVSERSFEVKCNQLV